MKETRTIKIGGDNDNVLSVNLNDILLQIKDGSLYHWTLLWIYAVGDLGTDINMLEFERSVNESESGLVISWKELNLLSTKFDQVFELILIGDLSPDKITRNAIKGDAYTTVNYAIELVDSSYWLVKSTELEILELLKSALIGSTYVD